jgi:hypothetical protein
MKFILTAVLMLTSSLALAECVKPDAPTLPDGESAELQAMVEAQKAVKAYVADTDAYLACLPSEEQIVGADADPDVELARIAKHNAAVDEMDAVAAKFNEEIRAYKSKPK